MNRNEAIQAGKLITAFIGVGEVSTIQDTFIHAMREKSFEHDDAFYLCGNLKFGPQSGRLASSDPNLQNIPANSTFGKLIKSCIVAPKGWLFAGADSNSLEDRVGAILSNDPNKIKEFSEGFDGHSLRAHAFFSKSIYPELAVYDPSDPNSINRIKNDFPSYRIKAKPPSFLLQYGGTAFGLNKNIGIPPDEAYEIEMAYHELYAGIAEFNRNNIKYAEEHGYINCAFGLRLRTPVLFDTARSGKRRPYAAIKEGRSANNAVTQSWGMLMNRALIAIEKKIRTSKFCEDIRMANTIHDAGYFLVRKDPSTVMWLNDHLIPEMEWNDHPLIKSSSVPMGAELDIGNSWDQMITLPNNATLNEITKFIGDLT